MTTDVYTYINIDSTSHIVPTSEAQYTHTTYVDVIDWTPLTRYYSRSSTDI